jgi:hypothetical protein
MAVLTKGGPQRLDGTNPELMQPSKVLGEEPCISKAACATSKGIVYLSDSGLVLFNLVDTSVFTDGVFNETWFRANISPTGAVIAENDGILYLFHSGGTLRIDARSVLSATTMTLVAYAAYKNPEDGKLYVVDEVGIKKLHGTSTSLPWRWESGDILFQTTDYKAFPVVRVSGRGNPVLSLYVDGSVADATKTLAFWMERTRSLSLPSETNGRAIKFLLTGTTDSITEVVVEASAL